VVNVIPSGRQDWERAAVDIARAGSKIVITFIFFIFLCKDLRFTVYYLLS
jgi:hypothetical protein